VHIDAELIGILQRVVSNNRNVSVRRLTLRGSSELELGSFRALDAIQGVEQSGDVGAFMLLPPRLERSHVLDDREQAVG
jgi:hypothetical protein